MTLEQIKEAIRQLSIIDLLKLTIWDDYYLLVRLWPLFLLCIVAALIYLMDNYER